MTCIKKYFIFTYFFSSIIIYSQDSNIVKFFPLNVGNVWVYNGYKSIFGQCSTVYLKKVSIDSSITVNNKIYYKLNITTNFIGGNGTCHYSFLYTGYFYRIDSITGNIYMLSSNPNCSFNPSEVLFDSLKSRLNDTTRICSNGSILKKILVDTSLIQVFGIQKQTKNFRDANYFEYATSCRFSKDFGVSYFDEYGMSISSQNWIKGCILNGVTYGDTNYHLVSLNQISTIIPNDFSLSQNLPNPFNPVTRIDFDIPNSFFTKLIVYDQMGREIETLVNGRLAPGSYKYEWNAADYPSGVYFYKLMADEFVETKKMILIK